MTSPNIDSDHKSEENTPGRDWFLQLCERVRILPRLESDKHGGTPLGARPLTQDEETGKSPVATDPAALALATDIAQRGFQWRDEETRRLADRAGLLLSAASVVIGLATAFGGAGFATNVYTKGLLIVAFGVYVILALLMVLALRPRPLRRDTGYAVDWVWTDKDSLHRKYQEEVRDRVKELDRITKTKACMVTIGAGLLALEVPLLTLALIIAILEGEG
jgi:hypothetical protein